MFFSSQIYHERFPKGARNGEKNGLSILLDAEKFNYAYFQAGGAGFKISIQDHRDKPIIEHMGLFIHSGQETQIAIYPQVTYTTNDAIGKTMKKIECTDRGNRKIHT